MLMSTAMVCHVEYVVDSLVFLVGLSSVEDWHVERGMEPKDLSAS